MAFQRTGIDAGMQGWLREIAAQVRQKLYGEAGCPEWGTRFREIERTGMSVGREISRLVMEQVVEEQARQVPDSALVVEGDVVQPAGHELTPIITEAGPIQWNQPRTMLKHGRKAYFPPPESAGTEGR